MLESTNSFEYQTTQINPNHLHHFNDFHLQFNNKHTYNQVQPWHNNTNQYTNPNQAQSSESQNHGFNRQPDVQKFLSTVKHLNRSRTQKNRKKQFIFPQTNVNNQQLLEINQNQKLGWGQQLILSPSDTFNFTNAKNNINQLKLRKQQLIGQKSLFQQGDSVLIYQEDGKTLLNNLQYKNIGHQDHKLVKKKGLSKNSVVIAQAKSISKKDITLNPFFQKSLTYQQKIDGSNKLNNNLQKLLKMKQNLRKKKLSLNQKNLTGEQKSPSYNKIYRKLKLSLNVFNTQIKKEKLSYTNLSDKQMSVHKQNIQKRDLRTPKAQSLLLSDLNYNFRRKKLNKNMNEDLKQGKKIIFQQNVFFDKHSRIRLLKNINNFSMTSNYPNTHTNSRKKIIDVFNIYK